MVDGSTVDIPIDDKVEVKGNQFILTFYEKDEDTNEETIPFADLLEWTDVTGLKFNLDIDEALLNGTLAGEDGYYINGGVAVQSNGIWPDWTKWAIGAAEDDESVAIRVEPDEDGNYGVFVGSEAVKEPEPFTPPVVPGTEDDEPKDSKPEDDEPAKDDTSKKEEDKDPNANPNTGATAALAAVGVALAGAAVIASKKRK